MDIKYDMDQIYEILEDQKIFNQENSQLFDRLEKLREIANLQKLDTFYSPYQRGFAHGLLLSMEVMDGADPSFFSNPKESGDDIKVIKK